MNDISVTTILLVEDEPIIAIDEKKVLEKYGYRVIISYSGEEAIETVDAHPEINLILMDIDLGEGMDGTRAAEIILKKHDMPLIFLSSHTEPETVEKTDSISSFGYITKMSGETILIAGIKMAFRLFHSKQKERLKEAALGQNQYFLHKAQKLGKIGHFSYDPESGIFEGSPELYRIFDLDQDNEGFKSITRAFHPDDKERVFASFDRTVREAVPFDMEHRIVQGDGTVLLVKVKAEMTQSIQGNKLVGIIQDITDIKAAEEALIKSRERFRQLVEYAPCGIILVDMDANITEVNQKQLDFLGKTREDILGKNFAHVLSVYGLDVGAMLERFKKRTTGEVEKFEYTFYEQSGRLVTAEAQTAPIIERGDITGVMYLVNDISERKKLTQTLRLQFENSPDMILIINRDYKIEVINHTDKEGFTVEDLRGMDAVTMLPAEHRAMVKQAIDRCIETGQRQELEHLIDEGRWALARFIPMFAGKEVVQVMIISTDITEQKLAKEKLDTSRALLAETERIGKIGGWNIDAKSLEQEWTDETFCLLEVDADTDEPNVPAGLDFIVPEYRSMAEEAVQRAIKFGDPFNQEWEIVTAKGNRRWVNSVARAHSEDGVVKRISGSIQDITDRKRAEEALTRTEEKFTKVFNLIPEPIIITTLKEGRHLAVNDAYLKKTGSTRDQLIGSTAFDKNIWPAEGDRQNFIDELTAKGFVRNYETQLRTYQGEIRDFLLSSDVIEFEGEECSLNLVIDVTESKKAEQAIKNSEEKFATAFKATPEAMSIASMKDGRFIEVNDALLKKTGYARDEVIGRISDELNIWVIPEDREQYINELIGKGYLRNFETKFRMSNKEVRDFILSSELIEIDGEKCGLNFMLDVTERKQAEEALRKSEEKFFTAFRASPEAMSITSLQNGRFIEVNDALLKKTGHTRDTIIGRTSAELDIWVNPDDRNYLVSELSGRGYLRNFETQFRMSDGEVRDFYFSSEIIELDNEKCALNFMLDITEQKKAEKDRKKSEEKFLKVFRANPASITLSSLKEGRYIDVNDTFIKRAGFSREEIIGRTSSELNIWLSTEERELFIDELIRNGFVRNFEVRFRIKSGEVQDYLISSEILELDGEQCVLNFMVNITERKKAEEALRKSEEKFAKAFKASPEVVSISSLSEGKYIEVNDIFMKKTGYIREEVIGHTSDELHIWADPEDRQIYINEMTGNGFLRDFEARFRMRNGEVRDFIVSSEVIEIDGEKCGLSFAIDITDRNRAEQARRKSEETFIKVFKASPEALTIVSMEDGRFIEVNDAFLKKAGFTRDEVIGHTAVELYVWRSPEERESFLRELKSKGYMRNYETRYRLKNGELRDFIVSSEVIEIDGESCILSFIIDITERKRVEEQVKALLAEKELLLKEINHRVKNNMNTISSLLSLQCDTLTEPAAINALNDAKSRIDSIRSLHDRLYKTENYRETSTATYLSSLADDIITNFPGSSRVTLNKEIDDFIIDVKRLQSLGIITNELLTNIMKYAFPDNREGMVSVRLKLAGDDVVLSVQDNGVGMPESVGFDNSSGFGLMLVHILTQQLRGAVDIEHGNGTTFVLTFPLKIILKSG